MTKKKDKDILEKGNGEDHGEEVASEEIDKAISEAEMAESEAAADDSDAEAAPDTGGDGEAVEAAEDDSPPPISPEELEYLRRRAEYLHAHTDKALFGWFNGSIFETGQYLSGFDTFFMRLAGEPEFSRRLLERLTEAVIADLKLYLEAVGEYIQVIGFGDDLGFQNGPQIDPRLFRSLVKPLLKEIYTTAHALSSAKVFLHSCGSVYEFIEDFIEIGVDILNPVQTSAARMDVQTLKERFGERIVFWGGGADVQDVLPRATAEEVRRDVRHRIEVMQPGGGFVFAPIHNLQADIPPQNITAMYEEALRG